MKPTAKQQVVTEQTGWNILFLPVLITAALVPLIVRQVRVNLSEPAALAFGFLTNVDFFSQAKAMVLMVLCVGMAVMTFLYFNELYALKDKRFKLYAGITGVFLLFTLLSSLFSLDMTLSFYGFYDRAEGFFTIACYMLLFLYTACVYRGEKDFYGLIAALCLVTGITAFLGVFQYFGKDLIASPIGKWLVIPAEERSTFSGFDLLYVTGKLYGTFYHYNYVGSFTAMVIPLFSVLMVAVKSKKIKAIIFVFWLAAFWLLLGSTSRAGLTGVAAAAFMAVILFGPALVKQWKLALLTVGALGILAFSLHVVTGGRIFERLPSFVSDGLSVFKSEGDFNYLDHIPIRNLVHNNGDVQLVTQDDAMNISFKNNAIAFTDSKGTPIPYTLTDAAITIDDARYANFLFEIMAFSSQSPYADALVLSIDNDTWFSFKIKENGDLHLMDYVGIEEIELDFAPAVGFNGKERLGSARGYIWSRSIPMLKRYGVLGCGPENFPLRFPQNDLLAKYWAYGTTRIMVDKPHNMYLQTFINCGGVAFVAFLALLVVYIKDSLKLYVFKKAYTTRELLGIGAFLAIIGYIFAGIFNDSVVSVAPIFWIILGVGVGMNRCLTEAENHSA